MFLCSWFSKKKRQTQTFLYILFTPSVYVCSSQKPASELIWEKFPIQYMNQLPNAVWQHTSTSSPKDIMQKNIFPHQTSPVLKQPILS